MKWISIEMIPWNVDKSVMNKTLPFVFILSPWGIFRHNWYVSSFALIRKYCMLTYFYSKLHKEINLHIYLMLQLRKTIWLILQLVSVEFACVIEWYHNQIYVDLIKRHACLYVSKLFNTSKIKIMSLRCSLKQLKRYA